MEGAADLEGHHPADPETGGRLGGPLDTRRGAGDHDLARGVVVGQPALVGESLAGFEGLGLPGADHGHHAAGVAVGGGLGGLGPPGGQADAVLEGEGAGGDEGGDLAQGVAGEPDRCRNLAPHRLPGDQRRQQDGELGFPGAGEVVGRLGQQQVGQRLAQGRLRPLHDAPGGVLTPRRPHGGALSPLARKDDGDSQSPPVPSRFLHQASDRHPDDRVTYEPPTIRQLRVTFHRKDRGRARGLPGR